MALIESVWMPLSFASVGRDWRSLLAEGEDSYEGGRTGVVTEAAEKT